MMIDFCEIYIYMVVSSCIDVTKTIEIIRFQRKYQIIINSFAFECNGLNNAYTTYYNIGFYRILEFIFINKEIEL